MELIRKHKIYFAVSEGYKDYLCSGTTTEGSAATLKSNPCKRDVHCKVVIAAQTEVKKLVAEVTFISSDINKVHVVEMLESVVVRIGSSKSQLHVLCRTSYREC